MMHAAEMLAPCSADPDQAARAAARVPGNQRRCLVHAREDRVCPRCPGRTCARRGAASPPSRSSQATCAVQSICHHLSPRATVPDAPDEDPPHTLVDIPAPGNRHRDRTRSRRTGQKTTEPWRPGPGSIDHPGQPEEGVLLLLSAHRSLRYQFVAVTPWRRAGGRCTLCKKRSRLCSAVLRWSHRMLCRIQSQLQLPPVVGGDWRLALGAGWCGIGRSEAGAE
jgi:hypothetical protein